MTGDKLALGAVAALALAGLAKRRGSRALPSGGEKRLVELVNAGHVDQARELCEALGVPLDLSGGRLVGDFSYIDLSNAVLTGVNFTGSILDGANLRGADLRGACIGLGTTMWGADLTGADLSDADVFGVF